MEQKRTLWIVAAVGVFLLVVVGAALILYSPSSKTEAVQTVYTPEKGYVAVSPAEPAAKELPRSPYDFPPAMEYQKDDSQENPFDIVYGSPEQVPSKADTIYSDNLTVYAENVNFASKNTGSESASQTPATTIDINLNELRASTSSVNIVEKNEKTSSRVVEDYSYYTPSVKKTESKTVETKKTETKAAPAKTSVAKTAPAKKPAQKIADKFWIQAASFNHKQSADEARKTLEANKIPNEVFTYTDAKGNLFYRVRVGPYKTSSEAEFWQKQVAKIDKFASTQTYIVNSSAKAN